MDGWSQYTSSVSQRPTDCHTAWQLLPTCSQSITQHKQPLLHV